MATVNLAQCMVDRTAVTTGLDDAIFTMHFQADLGFDTVYRTATMANIKTFWTGMASSLCDATHKLREIRWYDVPSTAPYKPVFAETTTLVPAGGSPGVGLGVVMPPQNACTVTLRTASRKHWGRFYLPLTATANMDGTAVGSIKQSVVDGLSSAAATLASHSPAGGGAKMVVWSKAMGTWQVITNVEVDNVSDIQRRRRLRHATYKKIIAL